MGECRLRPRARADLGDIWRYSAETWSVDQAEAYIRQINATLQRVASDPSLERPADDIQPGYMKRSSGSHVIFYKATKHRIGVIRVLHQRMNLSAHL